MLKKEGGTPRVGENKSIATIDFKLAIESKLLPQYPLIIDRDETFATFMSGELHYCSISTNTKPGVREEVIIESLRRAQNEEAVQYSSHGAEHQTYLEVLRTMSSYVQDGQATIQTGTKSIPIDQKPTLRPVETFVLTGPAYERQTYIPKSLKEALDIQADPQSLIKIARKFALDPQYGYAFAVLFLTFKGASTDTIKSALSNRHWLHDNENKLIGRILKEGHVDSIATLVTLHNMLLIPDQGGTLRPTTDPDAYQKALYLLQGKGFATKQYQQALGFVEVVTHPHPLVVFTSMTELAEKLADPTFQDPVRHKYVYDKFGSQMTTRIKTAYLVFD